jgi:TRAP-type C4-dicarboxylate transport system substrate-binding protein
MSRRRFDEFSAGDQELIRRAATQSVPYMRELWDRAEAESRAAVVAAGVQVTEVDRSAFHRAAEPVLEKYLGDAELRHLYEGIRAAA